jgi:hypothetical protein
MKITVSPRLDGTYIEKAWKHAETEEIEDLAAGLLGKAQEAQSIEDDLFCVLYLAFRCASKRPLVIYAGSWAAEWIDPVTDARMERFGTEIRRGRFSDAHAPN